jgi:uncharacterized protein HemX
LRRSDQLQSAAGKFDERGQEPLHIARVVSEQIPSFRMDLSEASMSGSSKAMAAALCATSLALLAGCGGVSELTRERVARSETAVKQSQQTLGNSEAGAVEMQRAREHLEQAQAALKNSKEKEAERHAKVAELDAELAVAKSQSTSARRAADELLASIQTLRREASRGEPLEDDPQQAQDE